jgi:hypothetical protein
MMIVAVTMTTLALHYLQLEENHTTMDQTPDHKNTQQKLKQSQRNRSETTG